MAVLSFAMGLMVDAQPARSGRGIDAA